MTIIPDPVQHPRWCAGAPLCTASPAGLGAAHRSEPVAFSAPAVTVTLALHRSEPGWPTDTFMTATVSGAGLGALAGAHDRVAEAGITMSVEDGWRLADTLTALLEMAR